MPAIALCFFYDADGQAITQKKKQEKKWKMVLAKPDAVGEQWIYVFQK